MNQRFLKRNHRYRARLKEEVNMGHKVYCEKCRWWWSIWQCKRPHYQGKKYSTRTNEEGQCLYYGHKWYVRWTYHVEKFILGR